jgi:beta-glucanase (GH16 family)
MSNLRIPAFFLALFLFSASCKKATSSDSGNSQAPTNLSVSAAVSPDSSGTVLFTSTANNATSYSYDFGDGNSKTTSKDTLTYKYSSLGTNTYTVTVTAYSASGLSAQKSIPVTVNVASFYNTLLWSDEFSTDGPPDSTKWGYDIGNNYGWGNSELEYYTSRPQNVIVQNGVLKIYALKESYNGYSYTSGRMNTLNKFSFTYGRVDISAQLPASIGTSPSLWMLGSNIASVGWPACGEIDLMNETGKGLNAIYGSLEYVGKDTGNTTLISNSSTAYHKYSLQWSPTTISIYVDDVSYFTFANSSGTPFNLDFFFIFNIAMGGAFGGAVDPGFTKDSMMVDYIRVYH